jgi:hypothetical protein
MDIEDQAHEDPRLRSSYIHIYFSTEAMIAWEFLRRNTTYQADYDLHIRLERIRRHLENFCTSPESFTVEDMRVLKEETTQIPDLAIEGPPPQPDQWGLACFESPSIRCDEAALTWLEEAASVEGCVTVRPKRTNGRRRDPLMIESQRICSITEHGCHTTIAHSFARITLRSDIPPFPHPDQALDLSITQARHLSSQIRDIFDREPRDGVCPPMTRARWARLLRFEKMLRTFDANTAGYSQRRIAELLYSPHRVQSEWNSREDMRKEIQRLLRRAASMVNGQYLDLVRSRYYERNFEQS